MYVCVSLARRIQGEKAELSLESSLEERKQSREKMKPVLGFLVSVTKQLSV